MTKDQIIDETMNWPDAAVVDLIDGILLAKHGPDAVAAWNDVACARAEDVRTGAVEGVPGDQVSGRIAAIVGM